MRRLNNSLVLKTLMTVLALASATLAHGQTEAIDDAHLMLPDADDPYPFKARDVSIEDALRMFSRNLRIGLNIAEDIDGDARGDFDLDGSRLEYLEQMAALYDFGWYYDGSILHVFAIGQMQTKVYSLQQTDGAELISMLRSLGVYQRRFFHRADARRQALLVSGPESYLAIVDEVVEALETAETRKVRVLRGSTRGVSQTIVSPNSGDGSAGASGDVGGS